jgi:hypothetical protein
MILTFSSPNDRESGRLSAPVVTVKLEPPRKTPKIGPRAATGQPA